MVLNADSFVSDLPLGSPKYIPPVSSLTINISRSRTFSCFSEEESLKYLERIAGLRFAKRSSSDLKPSKALSGLRS